MGNAANKKTQRESMVDENESNRPPDELQLRLTIVKLDIDCFEELFEWLSLSDLRALRRTCKRLQQVVDYFIRTNYPAVKIGYGKICLSSRFDVLQQYDSTSVRMIKSLKICDYYLTEKEIDIFRKILPQIEEFYIGTWRLEGDFYEMILKWCSNLRYLSISSIDSTTVIGDENQWLCHHYPLLEHIELDTSEVIVGIQELKVFFQLNPNIQIFSTTADLFSSNQHFFLGSNIKIDRLDIKVNLQLVNTSINRVCTVINRLYDQGFYKRVHMYVSLWDQIDIDDIASIRGMEKLYLSSIETDVTIPPMPDLRELALVSGADFDDWETIARNLVNLERVYFKEAECNVITTLLRYAPKLKQMKVDDLEDGDYFENEIIDLAALNKERGQLIGATKVTIYVDENVFLSTKFAITETEFNLVTLQRAETVQWINQFR